MDGYRKVQTARDLSGLFALLGALALFMALIGPFPYLVIVAAVFLILSAYFHSLARKRKAKLDANQ